MFQKASRIKLRFASTKGNLSVEDLWDLSLTSLDVIYKSLRKQQSVANEESLLDKKSEQDAEVDLKIEIVKHIFLTKQAEATAKARQLEVAAEKRKLIELIAQKKQEVLGAQSVEELEAKLAALG